MSLLLLISFLFALAQPVQAQLRPWENTENPSENCVVDGVPTLKCLDILFGNILFISSAFVVLVLFIMFLIGGFNYLTSFGNPEKIKKAQGTLKYAVIGLILFVVSFLIINLIDIIFLGGHGTLLKFNIGG